MHKLCALLLLTITAWLLVAPLALSESDQTRLPACCRRSGAHHCAGAAMGGAGASVGRALQSEHVASMQNASCMLLPRGSCALLHHPGLTLGTSSLPFEASSSQFFSTSALEGYAYAQARRAPRGPPSLLAHA